MGSFPILTLSSAEQTNLNELSALYMEIKQDLGILEVGDESFGDVAKSVGSGILSGIKYLAKKIGRLTTRLIMSLRNVAERTFLRYESIVHRWNKRIINNTKNLDMEKFDNRKIRVVSYDTLSKRIDAVYKVQHLLNNVEAVCDSPVNPNSEDWRTSEFMSAYRAMQDIGFDANRFDLVRKVSADYDKARIKGSVEGLGYTFATLRSLVEKIGPIAKYADKKTVTQLTDQFVKYSDQLTTYEKSIKEHEDLDSEEREEKMHILNIKIARLWWLSHFVKANYVIAGDIVMDVLKLSKVAEECITTTD